MITRRLFGYTIPATDGHLATSVLPFRVDCSLHCHALIPIEIDGCASCTFGTKARLGFKRGPQGCLDLDDGRGYVLVDDRAASTS
jgi:hypothetical protein